MKLAAALYVRNEEDDIAEWLAFHHVVGVDRILVFDNLSNDRTRAVVRRAARFAPITLLPWPIRDKRAQNAAYKLALWWLRAFDWVAFIDSDEFLVPTEADSIKPLLARLQAYDALALNWAIYGSSGHDAAPDGLVTERFLRRAEDSFGENRLIKSIVRPGRVHFGNLHRFDAARYADAGGKTVIWDGDDRTRVAQFSPARVNHYFTRSREHWSRKLARGYRDIVRPASAFDYYDRNEVHDPVAARFAPAVRRELERRGQLKTRP